MKAEYIFNLFMMAPPRKEPIDVTQNDNLMVELVAKLKNRNGTAFLPPEGAVANFIAVKPDGHGIVLRSDDPEDPKVTLADDEVRVSLPREALAVTGWIACKIAIQDNDAVASSQEFSLICNRDLLPEDFTESEAYQSIIYYLEHLGAREAEFDDMKEQFYQAINGLTEDDEVINARIDGPYSTTYDTLKLRLDAMSALLKGIVDGDFENRVSDLEDEVEDARGEFDALVDRLDDTDGRIADNAGEIDSAKVKILQLEQENKQLKKIVEDSNPTQSPRVTSTGYGVVSLPKNAAQGPLKVKVEGQTLKNELNYTPSTWAEWSKHANVTADATGLTLTANNTDFIWAYLPTSLKPSTKYGILYYVLESTLTDVFELENQLTGSTVTLPKTIGNAKAVITTQATITTNRFAIRIKTTESAGNKIKLRDFRVFELPTGSQIDTDFTNLSADELAQKYQYVQGGGVRNTSGTFRVRSVNEDETISSEQYVVGEKLISLPNGIADSIENGKRIQSVKEHILLATDIISMKTDYTSLDYARISKPSDFVGYNSFTDSNNMNKFVLDGYSYLGLADDVANIGTVNGNTTEAFLVGFPKGTTLQQAREALAGKKLTYQLASPIETPVQVSGSVQSYPNGTVYIEPAIADAGVYDGGFAILNTDFPIAELESVQKIDFQTGLSTELDVGQAVIAGGGLSFTHPGLTDGDIVFVTYLYDDSNYTAGKATCEYYDSRFVLKDTVTGKYYRKVETVEDGELVTQLVEV